MESHSPNAAPNDPGFHQGFPQQAQGDYGMDRGSGGGLFDFLPGVASLVEDLDKRMGLYVIRGENLVLLAELDMHKVAVWRARIRQTDVRQEQNQPKLREVPLQTIMAQKAALKHEKAEDELLRKKLSAQVRSHDEGFFELGFYLPDMQALGLGFEDSWNAVDLLKDDLSGMRKEKMKKKRDHLLALEHKLPKKRLFRNLNL
eukprot:747813-Hanusia_phi.AAC.1